MGNSCTVKSKNNYNSIISLTETRSNLEEDNSKILIELYF